MERAADLLEEPLELEPALLLRDVQEALSANCQQVKRDKGSRSALRELLDPRGRRVEAHLQAAEVEPMFRRHHDLAVHHGTARQLLEKDGVQLGEVAIEGSQRAALDVDIVRAPEDDRAKPVPLGLKQKVAVLRDLIGDLGEHGFDGRRNSHAVN